jgi:hypothetical protein
LGRGVRDLNSYTEGIVVGENPPILDAGEYLNVLETNDRERAESLVLNCKLARMLHG